MKGWRCTVGKFLNVPQLQPHRSGSDCAMGILDDSGFTLKTFNPLRKFTETSAAAHTLYEKSDPYFLPGPGGVLNLKGCTFKAVNDGEVYVSGSKHEATPYALKLEGARQVGFRCLTIAGTRDPIMIASIDTIIEEVKASVKRNLSLDDDSIRMTFHLYGKNGVMGCHEPVQQAGHELGIVLDVVAPTQETANSVCSLVRSTMLHYGYKIVSPLRAIWLFHSLLPIFRVGPSTSFRFTT